MALLSKKPTPTTWPAPPSIHDDPEFAAAAGVLSQLRARKARAEQELEREALIDSLAARPSGKDRGAPVANGAGRPLGNVLSPADFLRERLEVLNALGPYDGQGDAATARPNSLVARALAVVAGAIVAPPASRAERERRIRADLETLDAAIEEQHQVVEELRDDLSVKLSNDLKPVHDAQLRELFEACRRVAELSGQMGQFWHGVHAGGFKPRGDIVPRPPVTAPLHLGTEADWNSQISEFRRFLIARGVLS